MVTDILKLFLYYLELYISYNLCRIYFKFYWIYFFLFWLKLSTKKYTVFTVNLYKKICHDMVYFLNQTRARKWIYKTRVLQVNPRAIWISGLITCTSFTCWGSLQLISFDLLFKLLKYKLFQFILYKVFLFRVWWKVWSKKYLFRYVRPIFLLLLFFFCIGRDHQYYFFNI